MACVWKALRWDGGDSKALGPPQKKRPGGESFRTSVGGAGHSHRLWFSLHLPSNHTGYTDPKRSPGSWGPPMLFNWCSCMRTLALHLLPIPSFIFKIVQAWAQILFSYYVRSLEILKLSKGEGRVLKESSSWVQDSWPSNDGKKGFSRIFINEYMSIKHN